MSDERRSEGMNRRELLESARLAAAGGLLLAGAAESHAAPGAAVEDRGSTIRITGLKATPVGPKAYFKIETNMNVTGWGEVTGLQPKQHYVLALADHADGTGSLQPLAAFMTNPAGSAIVNAVGPIRQIVQNSATAERRYLVIAPGEPAKFGEAVQVQIP